MLGRCFYSLFPIIITLGTLAMALISFFGSFRTNAAGLSDIYFMQLNLHGVEVAGFSATGLLTTAGIYPVYQVGANGYCYGEFSNGDSDSVDISDCETPYTPFWFDLRGIFEDSRVGSLVQAAEIPDDILNYEEMIRQASHAVWSLLIVVACLSVIAAVLGIFSFVSKGLSVCIFVVSVLNALSAIGAAGTATGLFITYRNIFNDTGNSWGATAKLGTTGFGLIWGMAAAAIVAAVLWSLSMCCGSARTKSKDQHTIEKTEYHAHY